MHGANRPGGETSRRRNVQAGAETSWGRNVQLPTTAVIARTVGTTADIRSLNNNFACFCDKNPTLTMRKCNFIHFLSNYQLNQQSHTKKYRSNWVHGGRVRNVSKNRLQLGAKIGSTPPTNPAAAIRQLIK